MESMLSDAISLKMIHGVRCKYRRRDIAVIRIGTFAMRSIFDMCCLGRRNNPPYGAA